MPRFKTPDYGLQMIPVDSQRLVLPGSFEFALRHLVDRELDLSALRARFRNDAGGASAFDPAMPLRIVLLAYPHGFVNSRTIEAACRHNMLFMAISGDSCPHFTTLAAFVAELGDEVAKLFAQVLVVCDRQGLIGLFAIDGVKLPSNASKEKSGTRADFERQAAKMEAAVKTMMERQIATDAVPAEAVEVRATHVRERLASEAARIRRWLTEHPEDRQGTKSSTRLSNRTDNESAKMATGRSVIQGSTGVAAVDDKTQIILDALAHDTGTEQELSLPVVEASAPWRTTGAVACADAGYHSEVNLAQLANQQINAYICDNGFRQRDLRYAGQDKHKAKPDPLWDKRPKAKKTQCFTPADFQTEVIIDFYNSVRQQSKLGYLSPTAYERNRAEKHPIWVSKILDHYNDAFRSTTSKRLSNLKLKTLLQHHHQGESCGSVIRISRSSPNDWKADSLQERINF